MVNPAKLLRFKSDWEAFASRHPKFVKYLQYLGSGNLEEGDVLEIVLKNENGKAVKTNLKLSKEDMELFAALKETLSNEK